MLRTQSAEIILLTGKLHNKVLDDVANNQVECFNRLQARSSSVHLPLPRRFLPSC